MTPDKGCSGRKSCTSRSANSTSRYCVSETAHHLYMIVLIHTPPQPPVREVEKCSTARFSRGSSCASRACGQSSATVSHGLRVSGRPDTFGSAHSGQKRRCCFAHRQESTPPLGLNRWSSVTSISMVADRTPTSWTRTWAKFCTRWHHGSTAQE
eukprot:5849159-Prymnesium_polylepis.2